MVLYFAQYIVTSINNDEKLDAINFFRQDTEQKIDEICEDCSIYDEIIFEASEYKGRKVKLNDPSRSSDGKKKFYVYVKNDKGNVIKLGFGDPNMEIKRDDPNRRK